MELRYPREAYAQLASSLAFAIGNISKTLTIPGFYSATDGDAVFEQIARAKAESHLELLREASEALKFAERTGASEILLSAKEASLLISYGEKK